MIIGFEPLETLRIARKYANSNSIIVYDPRPVYPLGVLQGSQSYPGLQEITAAIQSLSARAFAVPAAQIAMDAGDARAANIALLGAFAQLPGAPLSREDLEAILSQRFRGGVLELNQKAFARGCEAVEKGGNG